MHLHCWLSKYAYSPTERGGGGNLHYILPKPKETNFAYVPHIERGRAYVTNCTDY